MTAKSYRLEPGTDLPHPLGRHVEHDETSKQFPAPRLAAGVERHDVRWRSRRPPFDQGQLGSCTGNAAAGQLVTSDLRGTYRHLYTEPTAVKIYERATVIDDFPGSYPPDDTGSSGLAVAKVALERRDILSYDHAFGIDWAIDNLMNGSQLWGTRWDNNMFYPDDQGFVRPGGGTAGGHEYLAIGYVTELNAILYRNSWGPWGPLGGLFLMHVSDAGALLEDDGDVTTFNRPMELHGTT